MQCNCGGVNADSHGTRALSCVGKFVREPNRIKRRSVKNAASPAVPSEPWCLFRGPYPHIRHENSPSRQPTIARNHLPRSAYQESAPSAKNRKDGHHGNGQLW